MGKRKGPKKKKTSASNGAGAAGGESQVLEFVVHAKEGFWAVMDDADCPADLPEDRAGFSAEVPGSVGIADLKTFLEYVAKGAEVDETMRVEFSSKCGKRVRADIHSMVRDQFAASLETFSEGFGDDRSLSIYKRGAAPQREASPDVVAAANRLFLFAQQAGMAEVSKDELVDQIASGKLTDALQKLLVTKNQEAALLGQICGAASAGDVAKLGALVAAHPELVARCSPHVDSGALPLQCAVIGGSMEAVKLLLAAGASKTAKDGNNMTALDAARKAEQCDVEAVLLQAGVHDPDADMMPVVADAPATKSSPLFNAIKATVEGAATALPASSADVAAGAVQPGQEDSLGHKDQRKVLVVGTDEKAGDIQDRDGGATAAKAKKEEREAAEKAAAEKAESAAAAAEKAAAEKAAAEKAAAEKAAAEKAIAEKAAAEKAAAEKAAAEKAEKAAADKAAAEKAEKAAAEKAEKAAAEKAEKAAAEKAAAEKAEKAAAEKAEKAAAEKAAAEKAAAEKAAAEKVAAEKAAAEKAAAEKAKKEEEKAIVEKEAAEKEKKEKEARAAAAKASVEKAAAENAKKKEEEQAAAAKAAAEKAAVEKAKKEDTEKAAAEVMLKSADSGAVSTPRGPGSAAPAESGRPPSPSYDTAVVVVFATLTLVVASFAFLLSRRRR